MADSAVDGLPAAATLSGGELLYLLQLGVDTKLDLAALRIFARARATIVTRTGTGGIADTEYGKIIYADASIVPFVLTLPATPIDGAIAIIRKSDTSANRVTIRSSAGADLAWLSAIDDFIVFHARSGAWLAGERRIAPITLQFAVSGTLTKAPLLKRVRARLRGGDGGGGTGRRGATGSIRLGGYGGAGGAIVERILPASRLAATEAITIGAGGFGAAPNLLDNSDGGFGADGGTTRLGNLLAAAGGGGGHGGGNSLVAAVPGPRTGAGFISGDGGMPLADADAIAPLAAATGGGGAGGSIGSNDIVHPGSAGAPACGGGGIHLTAGAAGNVGARGGGNGTAPSDADRDIGAAGGGGGYPSLIAAGGDGGHGGGGGGGAASVNGYATGAGGDGGNGDAIITFYFD